MSALEATHRIVETNGIRMHIAEQGTGHTVLLCHGFPECWYSWRHQLNALAAAGFHAVAPDLPKFAPKLRDVIMLPGCGHITQEERPIEVSAAMIDFIRDQP